MLAKPLCNCDDFIRLDFTKIMKLGNNNVASQCRNISKGGMKRAHSVFPFKKDPYENESVNDKTNEVAVQCNENAVTAANAKYDSKDKRPRNLWKCGQCRVTSTNLRQCWECGQRECRKCIYWCTFRPSSFLHRFISA